MRRELRRFIVQKHIFCPITGTVLDMDKSVFILDEDDDPIAAFSQDGWQQLLDMAAMKGIAEENLFAPGRHVDPTTVKP